MIKKIDYKKEQERFIKNYSKYFCSNSEFNNQLIYTKKNVVNIIKEHRFIFIMAYLDSLTEYLKENKYLK